ncbi:putative bifunctional diguanylate cyclase/phosphodiesterase [Actinotalea sp.]|uniref:putative bifunctional diguanylate cyclase/phosphodiesterase n=1 Tax=Actinotalea sp. TaxID=1872145 RepID=UPI003568BFE8
MAASSAAALGSARARLVRRTAADRTQLSSAKARLAGLLATSRDGVILHDRSGVVLDVNDAALDLLDSARSALIGTQVGALPVRWIGEDGRPVAPAAIFAPARADGSAAPHAVGVSQPATGAVRWVQARTTGLTGTDGDVEMLTVLADTTGTREAAAALARSEMQFRLAMENAPIGMVLADRQWRLIEVNAAFGTMLGVEPSVLLGRDLSTVGHPGERAAERAHVQQVLAGVGDRFTLERRYQRSDGQTIWAVLDAVLVRASDGEPDVFVVQIRDSTEARMQSEILAHRAAHDPLTGLANRAVLTEALQAALAEPDAAGRCAVLVVDLDEFKEINDRFGHPAGDEVLIHVAGVLRAASGGRGLPARLGGDEFVVLVQDNDAARASFEIAAAIHYGLANPVRTQRRRFPVRTSIGVAVVDDALRAMGSMGVLAAADAALYRAKASGRGRSEVYQSDMDLAGMTRHGAQAELASAIQDGQLVLHYQPIVDLRTARVVGHEALVRWQHPERGLLLPGSFLGTASEGGLAVELGTAVVRMAVEHLVRTSSSGQWVSVNVAAEQLGGGELVGALARDLQRSGLPAGRLVVELTETSLDVSPEVRRDLGELYATRVPVLIDAFGTGVPPLSYLRDLPVSGIKLDMGFTAGIPEDPASARVGRGLAAMATEMGLLSIAEGVENEAQATFLRDAGWRYGQGWYFGAARSADDAAG